jgi:hypothetical protein
MSTHATLIMKNPADPDGLSTKAWGNTLVHFDGYPAGHHSVGWALADFHNTPEAVAALLAAGDLHHIRDGALGLHECALDQHEPEWYATEQQAIQAARKSAGAYYYLWHGTGWLQLDAQGLPIGRLTGFTDQLAYLSSL